MKLPFFSKGLSFRKIMIEPKIKIMIRINSKDTKKKIKIRNIKKTNYERLNIKLNT